MSQNVMAKHVAAKLESRAEQKIAGTCLGRLSPSRPQFATFEFFEHQNCDSPWRQTCTLLLYDTRPRAECSRIRQKSEDSMICSRILTNPASTNYLTSDSRGVYFKRQSLSELQAPVRHQSGNQAPGYVTAAVEFFHAPSGRRLTRFQIVSWAPTRILLGCLEYAIVASRWLVRATGCGEVARRRADLQPKCHRTIVYERNPHVRPEFAAGHR